MKMSTNGGIPLQYTTDRHFLEVYLRYHQLPCLYSPCLNPYPANTESLCHQYRARPACTSVQSDQTLYCWLINFKSLKMIMESAEKWRWISPFKKFSMKRVKTLDWVILKKIPCREWTIKLIMVLHLHILANFLYAYTVTVINNYYWLLSCLCFKRL